MEYYSAIKKNEILPSATTWMDLEGIMLSEISQTEKDKCFMISLTCGILKKQQKMSLQNQRRDWWSSELGGEGWVKWVKVVKSYKLPVIQ